MKYLSIVSSYHGLRLCRRYNNFTHYMLTGYLKDTREFEETLLKNNMTLASTLYAPGQERLDRFKLNNMSFAGPVIMGIGGKLSKILSV